MYSRSCDQASEAGQIRRKSHQEQISGEGRGSKSWPRMPSPTSQHDALDPLEIVGGAADRDLLVGEDVPVAAGRSLQPPGLAGGEPVDRELHVRLELPRRLGVAGLVVDQLVAAAGQLVDAVDAAAQVVGADPEVELALDPARLGAARDLARVVAVQRLDRLLAELELVVGLSEPGPAARPPRRAPSAARGCPHRSVRCRCPGSPSGEDCWPWKRSSTWWMTIPNRWLIVVSCGMPKTRANLYFSGQVR